MAGLDKQNLRPDSLKYTWIVGNWKSHMDIAEAINWVDTIGPKLPKSAHLKVVICPGFTELAEVRKRVLVGGYSLIVGSQDLSPFREGPYTGEESAKELKGLAELSILGHSERREYFHETDALVAKKVRRALEVGIIPLVCVQGEETEVPREAKLVAYEPIFAIGSGHPDTPDNAAKVASKIIKKHGNIEVLYGGSVSSKNVKKFLDKKEISGVLVGGASLDPSEFLKIIDKANKQA